MALFAIYHKLESFFHSNLCMARRNTASTSDILDIWSNYNQVRDLTIQADGLFGPLFLVNIGYKFLIICTCAYSSFYYVFNKNDTSYSAEYASQAALILSSILVVLLLNLCTNVIFCSNLLRASEKLKSLTSDLSHRHWRLMEPEAKDALRAFRSEQEKDLVACPMNLFCITPSLLLNMTGLVVTYVVVLLQAK